MSLPTALGAGAVAYFGWRLVDDRLNLSSDVEMARRLLGLKGEIAEAYKSGMNVPLMWSRSLARSPDKRALVMLEEDGSQRAFTFRDVETESNRVARWLQGEGLKRGDTVALFMENRPEFVISWLGMAKIGVKVAMINTAIKEKGLTHCIKISGCRIVLFGAELAPQVEAILPSLTSELNVKLYSAGGAVPFAPCADPAIAKQAKDAISLDLTKDIGMADPFGYIYTSGTTGLPKAAIILHAKMFAFGGLMSRSFVVSDADVVYTVLPLFHSAGGGLGIGMMMYAGATVVLRKKFSAKVFFEDCTKHKVTVVQYIGELCRYLLATPPGKFDRSHKIRIAIGNGLRPEIWDTFQTRFNIPEIGEFYGATEGNAALVNHCRTKDAQGACGRQGWLMRRITGMKLARFDVQNEQIIRGPDGLCQECALGEPGELLFPIKADDPSTTFAGYNDKAATEKKIIRNAFAQGDAYFMTGDLLSIDAKGFIRFVDRIGDTFRWKGENCSTTEVAEVVSTFPGIAEANVYGVQIPNNQDGRAPAVAVTLAADEAKFDWAGLVKHCRKNLPAYSVPMFVRIQPAQETTATFKQLKTTLRSEGVDIAKITDKLLYLQGDAYVPLTPAIYGKITTPGAKL